MKKNKVKVILTIILTTLLMNTKIVTATEDYLKKIDPSNLLTDMLIDKVNVASDPDESRKEFNDEIENPTQQNTPTSVTVKPSDQITNLEDYKKKAQNSNSYAAVDSWDTLKAAYTNNNITYIEVVKNIEADANVATRDLDWRTSSIIIDGGGHTINMASAAFNVGTAATVRGSIFTITNINLIHWARGTTTSGDPNTTTYADAVIDSRTATGGYGYWHYNIDNVTLQGPNGPEGSEINSHPHRLLDAEDSQVTFSGKIFAAIKGELVQIGQVDIANNSTVEIQRTIGTSGFSMFYFMTIRANQAEDTGFAHTFTVGDGAKIKAKELSSSNGNNYPLVYYGYNSMTVGDNVEWTQDGFQMLLDLGRYAGTSINDRKVTFGQNLTMIATRTVGTRSLYATNRATVTFNAGTTLDLQQWNTSTSSVVQADAGSTITFISPKALHLSKNNRSGAPSSGRLFSGAGIFSMNNSQISTWQGNGSQIETPSGDRNEKFTNMTISGDITTVTDTAGNKSNSNIVDTTTRELSTNSIDPGTIKVNYLDQYGNKLNSVHYPISPEENYIGQFLTLKNKEYAINNMPKNYMWAIGKQVPEFAVSDAQSGGDPTTSLDSGDEFGQTNSIIVPMEGTEYTYNIYVYGIPNEHIQYEYKDLKTKKIIQDDFINSGQEKAGTDISPANYGNIINWTHDYYTTMNVPAGYHYATAEELGDNIQPVKTEVGLTSDLQTIYIYPDKQTVIVTLEAEDGSPLINQVSPISINGYSGQEISYKDLMDGKITQQGMDVGDGTFIFDFTDNKGSSIDKVPQYLTIKLVSVKVNMHIKQVYKNNNNQLIYKDLESQTTVNNSNNIYSVNIGDLISDVIDNLKSKDPSEIKIDYDWYMPIKSSTDYTIMVNGEELTSDKVPDADFELIITYTGITNFEVSDLDYGQIPITSSDNKIFDNPNTSQQVTVLNTDLLYDWELVVSIQDTIKQNGNSQDYLGGLLINKNGINEVIDKSGVKFSAKQEQKNPLLSKLPMDIKLFQNTGNTLGSYEGTLLWTLQDTP